MSVEQLIDVAQTCSQLLRYPITCNSSLSSLGTRNNESNVQISHEHAPWADHTGWMDRQSTSQIAFAYADY